MSFSFTGKASDVFNEILGGSSGNVLTFPLFLFREPQEQNEAATKNYVDTLATRVTINEGAIASLNLNAATKAYVDVQDSNRVSKSGDTMTGTLSLNADPTSAMQAATKQYVDEISILHTVNSLRLF